MVNVGDSEIGHGRPRRYTQLTLFDSPFVSLFAFLLFYSIISFPCLLSTPTRPQYQGRKVEEPHSSRGDHIPSTAFFVEDPI